MVQVGGAGSGQGADQVNRCGRVRVGADHAGRVVAAGFLGGLDAVDDVAAVVGQAVGVQVGRARLGVLAGDAGQLYDGHRRAVGQYCGHLQQGADVRADVGLGVGLEGLGTVAALQHERLAVGDVRQLCLQLLHLGGEHDRRHGLEDLAHVLRLGGVPGGLLLCVSGDCVLELLVQVARQRGQVRQYVFGDVDCPTHPISSSTNPTALQPISPAFSQTVKKLSHYLDTAPEASIGNASMHTRNLRRLWRASTSASWLPSGTLGRRGRPAICQYCFSSRV